MQIINEPEKVRIGCLGEQTIQKSADYRLMNYIFKAEVSNGLLVFNGLTGELIFLDSNEKDKLQNNNLPFEILENLIKKWFMVPNDYDEYKLCDQMNNLLNILYGPGNKANAITKYTVLTTTDCNARCFYCFEHGRKRINMSERVALDTAQYIIKSSGAKPVTFRWFGGEPLYNYEAIDIICRVLRDNNIEYSSSMVSNGYLFDDAIIEKSKDLWNLENVQITLDGTEEIYNRCKAFIYKDTNAFQRVMENIHKLLESGINVKIRMNMDTHNSDDLFALVDQLAEKFGNYSNLTVYTHLLFDNTDEKRKNRKFDERYMLMEIHKKLSAYIKSKGFEVRHTLDGYFRKNQCMADSDSAVVIAPDGSLGKCEHFSDDNFFGSIYSECVDKTVIDGFKQRRPVDSLCAKCPMYPACIRLKKCPDISEICDECQQKIYFYGIKNRMINTYQDYLRNNSDVSF